MDRVSSLRSGNSIAIDWRRSSVPQAPRGWPNICTCVIAVIGYTAPLRIKAGPYASRPLARVAAHTSVVATKSPGCPHDEALSGRMGNAWARPSTNTLSTSTAPLPSTKSSRRADPSRVHKISRVDSRECNMDARRTMTPRLRLKTGRCDACHSLLRCVSRPMKLHFCNTCLRKRPSVQK